MTRGPVEPVPPPPPDLAARSLPLVGLRAGTRVFRIHGRAHGPMHFSPGPGNKPRGRFDSPTGRFGTLYAAASFEAAFAETILRNPAIVLVGMAQIAARALSVLRNSAPLELVDLTGAGLSRLGLDARVLSGPYEPCGAWAEALHAHPAQPDGVTYPNRFDPSQRCFALFDRAEPHLSPAAAAVPLEAMPHAVGAALDRYGKALDAG